jgi:hypothetical protein
VTFVPETRLPTGEANGLLQIAGDAGKRIVRASTNQTDRTDDQDENDGKHHSVLGNVLTFFAQTESQNLRHKLTPSLAFLVGEGVYTPETGRAIRLLRRREDGNRIRDKD